MSNVNALNRPLQDADPNFQTLEGTMRLRVYNAGPRGATVRLDISHDNGDGTFDVTTFDLEAFPQSEHKGITTEWPTYVYNHDADVLASN